MTRGLSVLWRRNNGFVAVINGFGGCLVVESDGAGFLAQYTLLQVCCLVASVLEKGAIIIARLGMWKCCGGERMHCWQ